MGYENLELPRNSRFLVTGGAGFIGSNLTEALLRMGYEVRVLDDFSTGKKENIVELSRTFSFEVFEGSIVDYKICEHACKGIDYVLHQAAWGSVNRSITMPLHYNMVNVQGILNMMQAAVNSEVKKFIYASSSSVYGDEPTLPKVEGREGTPLSPYAITKLVNEIYAKNFHQLYGLKTIGLRYFNVFGRRQDPYSMYAAVIPAFIYALLENKSPIINGDGTHSRDFTYIENVIEANLKACLAGPEADGHVFNIAFGQSTSINELYREIARILGKNIEPIHGPNRVGDIPHSLASISKAQALLKYEPNFDLTMGLKQAINWYIEQFEHKHLCNP